MNQILLWLNPGAIRDVSSNLIIERWYILFQFPLFFIFKIMIMNLKIKFDPEGHDNGVLDTIEDEKCLPKRLNKCDYLKSTMKVDPWESYKRHDFCCTDEYVKAKAIVKKSAGSSIQQVREKLRPLIPKQETIDSFLEWRYLWEKEDGSLYDYQGDEALYRLGNRLAVRHDGFIYKLPRKKYVGKKVLPLNEQKSIKAEERRRKIEHAQRVKDYLYYCLRREKKERKSKEEHLQSETRTAGTER
jgi:hypothetical protein